MQIKSYLAASAALMLCGAGSGVLAAPDIGQKADDLIARIHFVGATQIAADPKAAKLNEIWALPESGELREEVVQKLATTPFRVMNKNSPERKEDHAAQIRPLIEDLLKSEFLLEMRGGTNAWPETLMAVRLDAARAEDWRSKLAAVLTDWTGIPVKDIEVEGFKGWELKKHHNPNLFRFIQAGDWVVFGWGQDELKLQTAMVQDIKSKKRPVETAKDYWLHARLDVPAINAAHTLPLPFKLPKLELKVAGTKDGVVRPELKMQFAEPLNLKLDAWQIPTNTIYDPISSFTVARGIAPLLSQIPIMAKLNAAPLPNQMVVWAMQRIPFQTCFAMPVKDAKSYFGKIAPSVIATLNTNLSAHHWSGEATLTTNNDIAVHAMPFMSPFLRAVTEPAGDFLLGGIFASPTQISKLPWDSIFKPIAPTNVVYYDWELNGERMEQWRPLTQLYFMSSERMLPRIDTPAQKWLMAVKGKLDNSGTVGKLTAPNELTFVRNSRVGLTGVELTWLGLWVDAPGFPLEFNVEPRTVVPPTGLVPTGK